MSVTATERFAWNKERMLRVASVVLEDGPGLSWMSPERMTSSVVMALDWTLSGKDKRRGLNNHWVGM